MFGEVYVQCLLPGISEHCPLVVVTKPDSHGGGRPFRFFNFLADHEEFNKVIAEEWSKGGASYGVASICKKLKCIKSRLKQLHSREFKGT